MNKLLVVLIISTLIMSGISGLLVIQLDVIQKENSELKDEIFEVNAHLEEEQSTSIQLQNQIIDLQNQIEQLEQSLVDVENQRNELEEKIREATNRVEITEVFAYGIGTVVGLTYESYVNVTLYNSGINDVENLTLTIKMDSLDYFTSVHNVTIMHRGETIVIRGRVWYYQADMSSGVIIATLESNNQIIDEYKISIHDARLH